MYHVFKADPKLSAASKMPCKSWSLQALETCPASKNSNGQLVDACKGCYATTGFYAMPNVKEPRAHNKEDWKNEDWTEAMVSLLDDSMYFRWFDSGDMYSLELAEKIYSVMVLTPWVRHWLPTRMHKFDKFASIIQKMQALPNVVVRLSSDSIKGEIIQGENTSTIIQNPESLPEGATLCNSVYTDGKCKSCRACWDKTVKTIAYAAHGKKMIKIYKA